MEMLRTDNFDNFGKAMPDGRLTAPSDGKIYRLKDAILMVKKKGRPLTSEEMKLFEVEKRN